MKKFYLLILMQCCSIGLFAQAKSIEVDCQTPGWLSSKINYGDQLTVENLTVTGYINGTDIQFIRDLNLNRNLNGTIDLTNVYLVKGGEYITAYSHTVEKDNYLPSDAFGGLKPFKKLIYPKTVEYFEFSIVGSTKIDTIIISNPLETIDLQSVANYSYGYIEIPEGVKNIRPMGNGIHLSLPSSITSLSGYTMSNSVFYSYIQDPRIVKAEYETYNSGDGYRYYSSTSNSTFYIPKGTSELYKQSDFATKQIPGDYSYSSPKKNGNKFIEVYDVDSVVISFENKTYYVGDTVFLNTQIYPNSDLVSFINYNSNNDIAEIISNDTIKCLRSGNAQIAVTPIMSYKGLNNNPGLCNISIFEHTTGIDMQQSCTVKIGETIIINAQTTPLGKSDNKLTYVSSDENIATVDEKGTIFGIKQGECRITAISIDGGYTAECTVNVIQPVEEIELSEHSIEIKKGDFKQLYSKILPSNANNKNVLWYSTDSLIASVNEQGMVEGLKSGNAYIKAMSIDNPTLMDSCYVTVLQPVEGISLNISEHTFKEIGESIQLTANVLPEDATNKEVKWKSFNESIGVVSNGKVFAVGFGTTVITATTIDGGFVDICSITVEDTTDIELIEADKGDYKIYDINGNQLQHFKIGVNIIKFKDGKVVKIVK